VRGGGGGGGVWGCLLWGGGCGGGWGGVGGGGGGVVVPDGKDETCKMLLLNQPDPAESAPSREFSSVLSSDARDC